MTELACQTTDLTVAYHGDPVLRHVNFKVPIGVVMGIIGPNGAGKSTLIKAMLNLIKPLAGRVEFFGTSLAQARNQIGYMPQSNSVDWDFPTTVADVVTMGTFGSLGWFKRVGAKERAKVHSALEQADILDLAHCQIGELSGGQRQRVFLARALVQEPSLYFMDEPFQGIDAKTQQSIVDILHSLRTSGKTVVLVHHDLATVSDYCDYVTLINKTLISSGPVMQSFTKEAIRKAYDVSESNDAFLEMIS